MILLVVGVAQGVNAVNALNQTLGQYLGEQVNQIAGTIFWNASGSYIVVSLVCFTIGSVGLYLGRNTQERIGEVTFPSSQTSKVNHASQIQCGSCGTMNDLDAVFCKKCGNKFG